jgi:hypothetical protein
MPCSLAEIYSHFGATSYTGILSVTFTRRHDVISQNIVDIPNPHRHRREKYLPLTGIESRSSSLLSVNVVARMWRLYKTGFGFTTGFIGSHHSYSVHTLQLTTVDHSTRLATAPQPVFPCIVFCWLSPYSSGPRTSCRPTHCLRIPSSLTRGNSAASAGSVYSPAGTYSPAAKDPKENTSTAAGVSVSK